MKLLRRRRGVDVILAEVILIAITLVAGVALVGYSFGLFGSLSKVAEVAPISTHCYSSNSTCVVVMSNDGSSPASADSCSISGRTGTIRPSTGIVSSGALASLSCQVPSLNASPGTIVYGKFTFTNGEPVSFVGVWNS